LIFYGVVSGEFLTDFHEFFVCLITDEVGLSFIRKALFECGKNPVRLVNNELLFY